MNPIINAFLALSTAVGLSAVAVPHRHVEQKQDKLEERAAETPGHARGIHKQLEGLKLQPVAASQPAVKKNAKLAIEIHQHQIAAKAASGNKLEHKKDLKVKGEDAAKEKREKAEKAEKGEKSEKAEQHKHSDRGEQGKGELRVKGHDKAEQELEVESE